MEDLRVYRTSMALNEKKSNDFKYCILTIPRSISPPAMDLSNTSLSMHPSATKVKCERVFEKCGHVYDVKFECPRVNDPKNGNSKDHIHKIDLFYCLQCWNAIYFTLTKGKKRSEKNKCKENIRKELAGDPASLYLSNRVLFERRAAKKFLGKLEERTKQQLKSGGHADPKRIYRELETECINYLRNITDEKKNRKLFHDERGRRTWLLVFGMDSEAKENYGARNAQDIRRTAESENVLAESSTREGASSRTSILLPASPTRDSKLSVSPGTILYTRTQT